MNVKDWQGVNGGGNTGEVRGGLQPGELPELFFIGAHGAAQRLTDEHHQPFRIKNGAMVFANNLAFVSGPGHGLEAVPANPFVGNLLLVLYLHKVGRFLGGFFILFVR